MQADVLVCSKGGGGLLKERMALAKELWSAGIKALFLQAVSPSLKEHYEYANAHRISWFAVIEKSTFAAADIVKVSKTSLCLWQGDSLIIHRDFKLTGQTLAAFRHGAAIHFLSLAE